MTALSVVADALAETGLAPGVTSAVGNPDALVQQAVALSVRSGRFLAKRFPWQELTREAAFATVAAEAQGPVGTLLPGFNFDLYQAVWNRTTRLPLGGPLFPDEWQTLKGGGFAGPFARFRVRGNQLLMTPPPPAGQTVAVEYVSTLWCQSASGTGQDRWLADTDTGVLDEDLLAADLKWRLLQAKGFDYAEAKLEAEVLINQAMARSGFARTLSLAPPEAGWVPRAAVQPGNFPG